MDSELTAQNERYLSELVSAGVYASRAAALNAAIEAMKFQSAAESYLADEALAAVGAVAVACEHHGSHPVDDAHWRRLDRLAEEVAAVTTL